MRNMILNKYACCIALTVLHYVARRVDAFSVSSAVVRVTAETTRIRFGKTNMGHNLPSPPGKCVQFGSMSSPVSEDTENDVPADGTVTATGTAINAQLMKEVEDLRRKAKELLDEANVSENQLRNETMSYKQRKEAEVDEIIHKLIILDINSTSQDDEIISNLATRLRTIHLSEAKLLKVVERIYQREAGIFRSLVSDDADKMIRSENELYIDSRQAWIDKIIAAQTILDREDTTMGSNKRVATILLSRYRELKRSDEETFQRKVNLNVESAKQEDFIFLRPNADSSSNNTLLLDIPSNATLTINFGGTKVTGSRTNMTRLLSEIVRLPLWFPAVFLPMVVQTQESLDIDDLKQIRSQILPETRFKCTGWDSIRFAAIYKGDFVPYRSRSLARGSSTVTHVHDEEEEKNLSQVTFKKILERMEETGLSERIQLFIMDDPEWRPGNTPQSQPPPVIIALPRSVYPKVVREVRYFQPVISVLAIVSTLFAIFAYSISAYALNPTIFDAIVNKNDISSLAICFPIFWGVLGLSALHELAHFVTAKRLKMDIGVPIPIPSLQIGTFGNITPLRSFPENRSDLLDFSLSGPLATFVVSLLCLVVGIFQTIHSPSDLIPTLATVPVALFKSSLLVGSIVSFLAPKVMMLPLSQPIPVHPLFMIGLAGIVSSALNLLPIGRLDGGRASTAIFGRRSSYIISMLTLAFLALAALTGSSTTSIFWGFIVTVFQRLPEIPVRDEISEVDNVRFGLYVLSVVITILVLTPFPGALNAI